VAFFGLFSKEKKESLNKGLEKTKENFFFKLGKAILGKSKVDSDVLDHLEEILISSDVGVDTTLKIIEKIEQRVHKEHYVNPSDLGIILREEIAKLLAENNTEDFVDFSLPEHIKPYVIMVVGVNGVGKTTTIGKLSAQYKKRGKKVVLGAADTFRAAAVDQLKLWGEKNDVPVISHGMNTDPASVAFDAVKQAVDMKADVVIIDTAGRLHTKINLMQELSKIKRVIQKFIPEAPHEVLLVLDGSTGQNALIQAREFTKATDVTALAITKLDGTAKGGVVIGISDQFKIPVKYIGVGEKIDDLQVFNKYEFVDSLFAKK
jgi:fused signal recognition particle receptor